MLGVADKLLLLRDGQQQAFGPRDEVLAALRKAAPKAQARRPWRPPLPAAPARLAPEPARLPDRAGIRMTDPPSPTAQPDLGPPLLGLPPRVRAAPACSAWCANLLMLTPTLYMLQVYDRVLISHSELTLVAVSLIACSCSA